MADIDEAEDDEDDGMYCFVHPELSATNLKDMQPSLIMTRMMLMCPLRMLRLIPILMLVRFISMC
jgi:hypothetical protein